MDLTDAAIEAMAVQIVFIDALKKLPVVEMSEWVDPDRWEIITTSSGIKTEMRLSSELYAKWLAGATR